MPTFIAVLSSLLWFASVTSQSVSMDEAYRSLNNLHWKARKTGYGPAEYAKLREIRDVFVKGGDSAAEFLITRIIEINFEERRFLRADEDTAGFVEFLSHLDERQHSSVQTRDAMFLILVEAYPTLGGRLRASVLALISDTYTPYRREKQQFLDEVLLRIGAESIPQTLVLASHTNIRVRCAAAEHLYETGKWITEGTKLALPGRIDCNSSESNREIQVQGWRDWWSANSGQVRFPKLPSRFEMPTR